MAGFADIKKTADSPNLVRKILEAVCVLAPMTAELPETLTGATGELTAFDVAYWPLGMVSTEGYERQIDAEVEEVDSFGYSTRTRSDVTGAPSKIMVTAQEYGRRKLMELIYGLDLSTVKQLASGEIVFDEPPLPQMDEFRLIKVGRDGTIDNEWLIGDGFPRVKLSNLPNESWKKGDPFEHALEFDVFTDDELGTACRHYIGGTAPKSTAVRTALGFSQLP